jgi:8-oxo-dGTP pyrophosphatase MutT (NUDIX family)
MSDATTTPSSSLDLALLLQWISARPQALPLPAEMVPAKTTQAAVLIPLIERPDGVNVLLTQRTAHLEHHPGQVSFPGGRLEPADKGDAIHCALRETEEEIGLKSHQVTVLGCLDERLTGTGFRVIPVVGVVRPPFSLVLDDFEVAEAFEVPIQFFSNKNHGKPLARMVNGIEVPSWSFSWGGRSIWGLTASILVAFHDELASYGVI